jgi:hypothetical protein
MAASKLPAEARAYLASIGKKGGRVKSKAKADHLSRVASKGGKNVTPRKLAAIQAMTAARVAKQQERKANGK